MQRQSFRFALWGGQLILALSLLPAMPAFAQAHTTEMPSIVTLRIDPKPMMEISPDIYGVNHDWNKVPNEETPEWIKFMSSTAGVNLMLYPGGWNPEHYDWAHNTMPAWRNHLKNGFDPATDKPGADPKTFLSLAPEAAFVTRVRRCSILLPCRKWWRFHAIWCGSMGRRFRGGISATSGGFNAAG